MKRRFGIKTVGGVLASALCMLSFQNCGQGPTAATSVLSSNVSDESWFLSSTLDTDIPPPTRVASAKQADGTYIVTFDAAGDDRGPAPRVWIEKYNVFADGRYVATKYTTGRNGRLRSFAVTLEEFSSKGISGPIELHLTSIVDKSYSVASNRFALVVEAGENTGDSEVPDEIVGQWLSDCHPFEDGSRTTLNNFMGDTHELTTLFYKSIDCSGDPYARQTKHNTLKILGPSAVVPEALEIDFHTFEMSYEIFSVDDLNTFNTSNACGVSNWELNSPQFFAIGSSPCGPSQPLESAINLFSGDRLIIGEFEDPDNIAVRPTRLSDDLIYYRTSGDFSWPSMMNSDDDDPMAALGEGKYVYNEARFYVFDNGKNCAYSDQETGGTPIDQTQFDAFIDGKTEGDCP